MQAREDHAGYYMPSQRLYLEEARSNDPNTYDYTRGEQELPYRSGARSLSPASSCDSGQPRQQQRGLVEPEELRDDPRGTQSNETDMMSMLTQQAMGMGLMGGKKRKKDKDDKGDFLSQMIEK
jgi:hypothetical protein